MKSITCLFITIILFVSSQAQPLSFLGSHKSELSSLYTSDIPDWSKQLRWDVDREGNTTAVYDSEVMRCYYVFSKYSGKCQACNFLIRSKEISDELFKQIEAKATQTKNDQWVGLFDGKYVIISLMYIGQNRMVTYTYDYPKNQQLLQKH